MRDITRNLYSVKATCVSTPHFPPVDIIEVAKAVDDVDEVLLLLRHGCLEVDFLPQRSALLVYGGGGHLLGFGDVTETRSEWRRGRRLHVVEIGAGRREQSGGERHGRCDEGDLREPDGCRERRLVPNWFCRQLSSGPGRERGGPDPALAHAHEHAQAHHGERHDEDDEADPEADRGHMDRDDVKSG